MEGKPRIKDFGLIQGFADWLSSARDCEGRAVVQMSDWTKTK
jgi:hypothetical protein